MPSELRYDTCDQWREHDKCYTAARQLITRACDDDGSIIGRLSDTDTQMIQCHAGYATTKGTKRNAK